jgi:GNAT superfamily N-acetyltransferase
VITVRPARPTDAESIVAVNAAGWRTGYQGIVSDDRLAKLPVERWRSEVRAGLARPAGDSFSLVGEIERQFAGYCYVAAPGRDGDLGTEVAELVAIYVEPAQWGKGVGAALIAAAEEEALARGYAQMSLWTFAENDRARGFYERRGWRADGSEKLHQVAGASAIRMRKGLKPIG